MHIISRNLTLERILVLPGLFTPVSMHSRLIEALQHKPDSRLESLLLRNYDLDSQYV
jgi:hypothetical protein